MTPDGASTPGSGETTWYTTAVTPRRALEAAATARRALDTWYRRTGHAPDRLIGWRYTRSDQIDSLVCGEDGQWTWGTSTTIQCVARPKHARQDGSALDLLGNAHCPPRTRNTLIAKVQPHLEVIAGLGLAWAEGGWLMPSGFLAAYPPQGDEPPTPLDTDRVLAYVTPDGRLFHARTV